MPPLEGPRATLCVIAKARVDVDGAVVHADGDGDLHRALALEEHLQHVLGHIDQRCDLAELLAGHLPRIALQVGRARLDGCQRLTLPRPGDLNVTFAVEGGVPSAPSTGSAVSRSS